MTRSTTTLPFLLPFLMMMMMMMMMMLVVMMMMMMMMMMINDGDANDNFYVDSDVESMFSYLDGMQMMYLMQMMIPML